MTSIPPNPPDSQHHSAPSPDLLHVVTEDTKRRLAEYAPELAEGQRAELWTEPHPRAVTLMVDQMLGRERHDLLDQCEHLDPDRPQPMWWIASREPGRLCCNECSNAARTRMFFLDPDPRLPNRVPPQCDLCRHERDVVVRGIAIAGLVIACLKLCESCLTEGLSSS